MLQTNLEASCSYFRRELKPASARHRSQLWVRHRSLVSRAAALMSGSEEILFARTALRAPSCVKSAATQAPGIHSAREPAGDERAQSQDCQQHQQVQQKILQALYFSRAVL